MSWRLLFAVPATAEEARQCLRVTGGVLLFLTCISYLVAVIARVGLATDLSSIVGPLIASNGGIFLVAGSLAVVRTPTPLLALCALLLLAGNAAVSFPAPLPLFLLALVVRVVHLVLVQHRLDSVAPSAASTS